MFGMGRNRSTRVLVLIMGVLTALGGVMHGVFSALHGNMPTEGYLSESLGGFTVIPNYLFTGIASIVVGIALLLWTVYFIHKRAGPTVYLVLSILLFLVGGGVALVLGFFLTWLVAT